MKITPRPYQLKFIEDIREAMRKSKKVLAVMATGGGKTVTFSYIAKGASAKKRRVWFVAHRENLLGQISSTLTQFEIKHGMICGGKPKQYYLDAQVCGIDSLKSRLGTLLPPDLIIMDEAHHAAADTWSEVIEYYPEAYVLGLTATPCRSDGRGLGDIFDEMVLGPSYSDLVNIGWLVDMELHKPPSTLDLSRVSIQYGDFSKEADIELDNSTVFGDIIDHYKKYSMGKPGLSFFRTVAKAQEQAQVMIANGINAASVDGKMLRTDIRNTIAKLGSGEIDMLNSCNLISEGTDIPSVYSIFMARPTYSESLYLQMCGRGSRPIFAPGFDLDTVYGRLKAIEASEKPYFQLFDHVNNTKTSKGGRHLAPIIDREWPLDATSKKPRKGEKLEIDTRYLECCGRVWDAKKGNICPICSKAVVTEQQELKEVDGDLVKVSKEEIMLQKKEARKEQGQASTLEALWQIKESKGHQKGWVKYVFTGKVIKDFEKNLPLSTINEKWQIKATKNTESAIKYACIVAFNNFISQNQY